MKRCLMIGAGGMADYWIRQVFPSFADRVRIVGLVDVRPEPLEKAAAFLGIPADACFREMGPAFDRLAADFCTVVIPPAFHEEAVMQAVARRMPILSEKPIADTWEACGRIYRAVTGAGLPMQVVQNYRYTPRIRTFKAALEGGDAGPVRYLVSRFA